MRVASIVPVSALLAILTAVAASASSPEAVIAQERTTTRAFNRLLGVIDDQASAPIRLTTIRGVALVTAACHDGDAAPGVEDPDMVISVTPRGGPLNIARQSGVGNPRPVVTALPANVPQTFVLQNSDTFDLRMERRGRVAHLVGVVRQDNAGSPNGACLFYGTVLSTR